MKHFVFLAAPAILFAATTLSFAVGLTEADYEYLALQNVERWSVLLLNLSPKEQARLHAIINFVPITPAALAKDIAEALAQFMTHQDWERAHPGQLWDLPPR